MFRIRLLSLVLVAAIVAAIPAAAAQPTQLRRVRGTVGYQLNKDAPFSPVAGTLQLTEERIVVTRAASNALLTLADSSDVGLGENTTIAVGTIVQAATAAEPNAMRLTVGTIRFDIRHPQGGRANYTFTTTTSQIAVRGTIGILATGPDGDTITCLDCAPGDVTVTSKRKAIVLLAGQTAIVPPSGEITVAATTAANTASFASVGLSSVAQAASPFIPGIEAVSDSIGSITPLLVGGALAGAAIGIEASQGTAPSAAPIVIPAPTPTASPVPTPAPTASPAPTPTHSPTPAPSPSGAITINARARAPQPVPAGPAAPAPAAPAPPAAPANPVGHPGGRP